MAEGHMRTVQTRWAPGQQGAGQTRAQPGFGFRAAFKGRGAPGRSGLGALAAER